MFGDIALKLHEIYPDMLFIVNDLAIPEQKRISDAIGLVVEDFPSIAFFKYYGEAVAEHYVISYGLIETETILTNHIKMTEILSQYKKSIKPLIKV